MVQNMSVCPSEMYQYCDLWNWLARSVLDAVSSLQVLHLRRSPPVQVMEVMDKISLRKDLKQKAAVVIQRWYRACADAMHGRLQSKTPKQGYVSIPDFGSQSQTRQQLQSQVRCCIPAPPMYVQKT